MNWETFEPKFGTWARKFKPFFDSGGFDPIYEFLKSESKRGKRIAPLSINTYRAFLETPFDEVKAVMVGMCPYHTWRNDTPVADGLLMGSVTGILQPSLEKFYESIERELYLGLNLNYVKNPDISYLAKNGVLLLNAGLTVELNKAGSHNEIWEPFMKYLFEEVLDVLRVPIIFLGKEATKIERYVAPFTWTFKVSHPASASYVGSEWDSEGVFKKVNKILKDTNNETIDWLDLITP